MTVAIPPILLTIDIESISRFACGELTQAGFDVIEATTTYEAKRTLSTVSLSCIVVMDYLAFSYPDKQSLLSLPVSLPRLTLIRPSREAMMFFDYIRYPPYKIHDYLTIPIAEGDILYKVQEILSQKEY